MHELTIVSVLPFNERAHAPLTITARPARHIHLAFELRAQCIHERRTTTADVTVEERAFEMRRDT
jgi:hypothetical protein